MFAVNGDEVIYEVAADPGLWVGDAEILRLTITDPFDLRDEGLESGIAPPESILVWREQLNSAVANQIQARDNIWAQLFGEVVFGGGATLTIDPIPDTVMKLEVDLMIDTDLRILLAGNLQFLDGLVAFPASLYADLSDLFTGAGRFLFLADVPEVPVVDPLLVLRGEAFFETLGATNVLDALVTQNGSFWDITFELAIDNPSEEFIVGDNAVVFGADQSAFDGTFEVIAIDDDASTITVRSNIDPGTWGTVGKLANENALLGGFRMGLEGGIDLNIPLVTTLTLEGAALLEFRIPAPDAVEDLRLDLEFDVALSETNVGNIGRANGKFHLTIDADAPAPDLANPFGGLEIWGAALLTTDFQFLETVGLFASASGLLRINSSTSAKPDEILRDAQDRTVLVALPAQSFAMRLDGSVDFRIDFNGNGSFASSESAFLVEGAFVLEFSAEQGFNVAVFREGAGGTLAPATLQLGPAGSRLLTFEVFGFLAVRDDGFAANMVLTTDRSLPLGLASIEATAVLIVNTTGEDVFFEIPGGAIDPNRSGLTVVIPKAAPTNPSGVLASLSLENLINGSAWTVNPGAAGAPYGVAFLRGDLELLSVLDLDISGYVLLSADVVSLELNFSAAGNFLNLASASASGSLFFSSEGEFVVDVHGDVQLGPDWININGSADLTISFLDDNGRASGGDLDMVLDIDGSLGVGLVLFGLDTGDLTLTLGYNGNSGAITVGVPYPEFFWDSDCWGTVFGDICVYYPNFRTAHFGISVGTLTADAVQPPPPVLGQVDGNGVLTLNVGVAAGARNLLVEEENEIVVIDQVGNQIRVSMFGHSQMFSGVTSILIADMAAGNDFVDVRTGVAAPLDVRFGAGNDRLGYGGSGAVRAFGEGGNDRLESGSGADQLFGGAGDDLMNGGAGNDRLEGGDDSDTLIGGDGSDTLLGGLHADLIAGDRAVVEGNVSSSVFRTEASAGAGSDFVHGGDAFDIIFGGGGSDTLAGDRGNDKLFGDDGMVTLVNDPNAQPVIATLDLGFSGGDLFTWAVGDGSDTVDGQLGSDRLDLIATDGSEQITLGASGAGFSAVVGAETLAVSRVETANVDARRGADTLTVNDLGASGLLQLNFELGADSVQDTVVINGSSGADTFTIAPSGNVLRVQKAGGATIDISEAGPASGGDGVALNAGDGTDVVNVLGTVAGTVTVVNGGAQDDTINVGLGTLNGLAGALTVNGGPGTDTLDVDDSGDTAANTGVLTETTIAGLGMAGLAYGAVERLSIGLGSGADAFTIESTHEGETRLRTNGGEDTVNVQSVSGDSVVDGGADDDTINVGLGTLNGLAAVLVVNGGQGTDTLNVDDSGDTAANTGELTGTTITGLGMAVGIAYDAVERLSIGLGSGADTFTIESTHDGETRLRGNGGSDTVNVHTISGDTTLDGGADDDTINAGLGTLNGLGAVLVVNGGQGTDTLNVDDSGDTAANTGALTGTTVTGLGMAVGIAYGAVETLNLDLGSGGDTFTIESTHVGDTNLRANGGSDTVNVHTTSGDTTVDGGADHDTINVGLGTLNGLVAALAVSGGEGADTLNVDDTGDTAPNTGALTATTITGLGMGAGIVYGAVETLVISLGSGSNHFAITSTMRRDAVAVSTTVNSGEGDDVVTVELAAATDGPLTVNLQGGNDVLDASGSSLGLTISGGEGRDVIAGGSGADTLHGDNVGDPSSGDADVIYGNLGNDEIHGGGGNDVMLGDTGAVSGRNVLLTDVVTQLGWIALNGPQAPGAEQAVLDALLDADLVLLAGRYLADGSKALHANGSWDSRALLLELVADGDDSLYGGDGDDALFGQRGNDRLAGDNGDDLISGGAGDDELAGGEGNDSVVGDNVYIDSAAATRPNVAHGLLLGDTALVPMVSLEPGRDTNAFASVLSHLFADAPADRLALGDGSVLAPLASVVTDFARHLGQLRGNDSLSGEGGNDTLVGDDQIVYARALAFDAARMSRAEAVTRSLLDVSDDFSDLVHRQYGLLDHGHEHYDDHSTVVDNVYSVGADRLDGGEGHDVLIGDDNLLVQSSFTLPAGLAGHFERFAEGVADAGHELAHAVFDLGDLDHHQREEVVQVPHGRHGHDVLVHHVDVVLMGNDILLGGNGNDQIVGDSFIVRTADLTLVAGGSTSYFGDDDAWQDNDWKDKYGLDDLGWKHYRHHDHHHDYDHHHHDGGHLIVKMGADTILGGAGADLIWGDSLALVSSTLTRGSGLGWKDFERAEDEAENALEAIVQLTDHHHHDHHHDGHWHHGAHFDNGDDISGGEGDDILFGQDGDDKLRGDAGNDWLVGGDGKDWLDGGSGKDRLESGNDGSSDLQRAIGKRMIDWTGSFSTYGLTYAPFGGLTLAKGGGHSNFASFQLLSYERPRHG